MRLGQASDLINVPPFFRDHSGVILPFNGQEKRSECAVAEGLHRIITLSLECFNPWLDLFCRVSREDTVSAVQDQDPYLQSLLRVLHSYK